MKLVKLSNEIKHCLWKLQWPLIAGTVDSLTQEFENSSWGNEDMDGGGGCQPN